MKTSPALIIGIWLAPLLTCSLLLLCLPSQQGLLARKSEPQFVKTPIKVP